MSPHRVLFQKILDIKTLERKEIRSLFALTEYYRRSIANFSKTMTSISDLIKGDSSHSTHWTTECQSALEKIQNVFICPILKLPNFSLLFILQMLAQ